MKIFTKHSTYKKVAGKIAKPIGLAAKVGGTALAISTVGLPAVAGLVAADMAKKYVGRQVEKKLDKTFGKSKIYRTGKAITGAAYQTAKGNYSGALNYEKDVYRELDPNKKRVEKFNKFNEAYIEPTQQLAGTYKTVSGASKRIEKLNKNKNEQATKSF